MDAAVMFFGEKVTERERWGRKAREESSKIVRTSEARVNSLLTVHLAVL
jgi:hypothetical protein